MSIKDAETRDKYCHMYSKNGTSLSNLKKMVKRHVKSKNTRYNSKLKSLLNSNHLK